MYKIVCFEIVVTEPVSPKAMIVFLRSVNLALKNLPKWYLLLGGGKLKLELVNRKGRVNWLIVCPLCIQRFLEEQLRAYFPDCVISVIDLKERKTFLKSLKFWRRINFVKIEGLTGNIDSKNFGGEFDPLSGMISALKTNQKSAIYQISLRKSYGQDLFKIEIKIATGCKLQHGHIIAALQGAVGSEWHLFWHNFFSCAKVFSFHKRNIIDVDNLLKFFHFPFAKMMIPGMWQNRKRELPLMVDLPLNRGEEGVKLGLAKKLRQWEEVYLADAERRRHTYIIGKTGMGKSTLIANMALSDIERGEGVCVIDPHGDLVETIMASLPKFRLNDVIYFNPVDREFPVGFNILAKQDPDLQVLLASNLVEVLKRLFAHSWGPRLEYILRNTVLSLLSLGDSNLLMINRLFVDNAYRRKSVEKLNDPLLRQFWLQEFERMSVPKQIEAIAPIQNKVGQFLSNPLLRNILGQKKSSFDLEWIINNKKIFLVNLSKGLLGEDNAILLGSILVNKLQIAAMARANIPLALRSNYYLFVDEFQNFVTDSFATILSEARKYGLCLTLANQYLLQLPEAIKAALLGNVGTTINFQMGAEDANVIAKYLGENLSGEDLVNLKPYDAFAKLSLPNLGDQVFSLKTLPLKFLKGKDFVEKIKKLSQQKYGKSREVVERDIAKLLAYKG